MKVVGNLKLLKNEIVNSFAKDLEEFKKIKSQEHLVETNLIKEQHARKVQELQLELEKEETSIFKASLSEEKLHAKREYEKKREEQIDAVFSRADMEKDAVLVSKDYINFIQRFIKNKKNVQLIGGLEEYKKSFPSITIDHSLSGIIVKDGDMIYDFTYASFVRSGKLDLRFKISQLLFDNAI